MLLLVLSAAVHAQKKQLTEAQMLRGASTNIIGSIPRVMGWIDDNRLQIQKKEHPDSALKMFVIDAKTGKSTVTTTDLVPKDAAPAVSAFVRDNDVFISVNGQNKQLTKTTETEVNPTLSPDREWVAFTRKNDLYTNNLS